MDKSRIKKVYAVILTLIGTLALAGVLYGCDEVGDSVKNVNVDSTKNVHGAVIPHHLLVSKDMNLFYEKLSSALEEEIEHVVIIAPNHFAYGLSYIQTTNDYPGSGFKLNLDLINSLNGSGALRIEPAFFDKEHGVFAHFDFIHQYFPNADMTPIIVKRDTPKERLDVLARMLTEEMTDNTMVIASIDFTHFEPEDIAAMDDERTLDWLNNWSERDQNSKRRELDFGEIKNLAVATFQEISDVPDTEPVAIDSPESLYVMTRIFESFEFDKRTSSALILKTTKPEANTTHLFGKFSK